MLDLGNVEKLVGEPQRGPGQAVGSAHPTPPAGWPGVTVIAFLLALSGIFGLLALTAIDFPSAIKKKE